MCTPVCAALGYLPQAEFDEEVARKDAQVRVYIFLSLARWMSARAQHFFGKMVSNRIALYGGRRRKDDLSMCHDKR